MNKTYITPRMEVMEMKMQGVLVGSSVTKITGGTGYTGGGTGGGRAPFRDDFDEDDLAELLDFKW